MHYFVFTDLDGTVLGHDDYRYQPVVSKIAELQALSIPVYLNSSKTYAELEQWQLRLGAEPIVICENGGVIVDTRTQGVRVLGMAYSEICHRLDVIRIDKNWLFEGFHDWSAQQVVEYTGLSLDEAQLAQQRMATEPLLWHDDESELEAFRELLGLHGLQLQKGGRFYHVMAHHDKAMALQEVIALHLQQIGAEGDSFKVIALGDGGNDLAMLCQADYAVVMPQAKGGYLEFRHPRKVQAKQQAPEGWVEAISSLQIREQLPRLNE